MFTIGERQKRGKYMTQEQVVNIATEISYLMLKNGAEIYRVEQIVQFIAKAYGYEEADCFAFLTSIVVSVVDGDKACTRTKRVPRRGTNLNRVAELNDLSRHICRERPGYEKVKEKVEEIKKKRAYPFWMYVLMYMIASFLFCLFFGGSVKGACYSAGIGIVVYPVQWFADKMKTNLFIHNLLTSGVATIFICVVYKTVYPYELHYMITALTMNLVPGVALTHSIRDLISNELISGIARFAEVAISGAGTAVGAFLVLSMFHLQI